MQVDFVEWFIRKEGDVLFLSHEMLYIKVTQWNHENKKETALLQQLKDLVEMIQEENFGKSAQGIMKGH
jgi:hypothetical protein